MPVSPFVLLLPLLLVTASAHAIQTAFWNITIPLPGTGRTGWFRLSSIDTLYQPTRFDTAITAQLLQLTKTLDGWQPANYQQKTYDSYQYLTFKLTAGRIECILP